MEGQFRGIQERLEEREEEVNGLKRMFVEKLKDIETSFVELS
jgi:hypothetical protein